LNHSDIVTAAASGEHQKTRQQSAGRASVGPFFNNSSSGWKNQRSVSREKAAVILRMGDKLHDLSLYLQGLVNECLRFDWQGI
jgi:hypothetical protein